MPKKRNTRQKIHRSILTAIDDLDRIIARLELIHAIYENGYPDHAIKLYKIITRLYIEREMLQSYKSNTV